MEHREEEGMREREIVEKILTLLSGMDKRKLNAIYRFVLGIK